MEERPEKPLLLNGLEKISPTRVDWDRSQQSSINLFFTVVLLGREIKKDYIFWRDTEDLEILKTV